MVKSFVDRKKDFNCDYIPAKKSIFRDKDYDENTALRVRMIRIDLLGGEVEVLMTSLFDSQEYPASMFKELYFFCDGELKLFMRN